MTSYRQEVRKTFVLKVILLSALGHSFLGTTLQAAPQTTQQNQAVEATQVELCKPALIAQPRTIPSIEQSSDKNIPPNQAVKTIEADQLIQTQADQFSLQGQAVFSQPGLVFVSDEANFNQTTETAEFIGHVELHQPNLTVTADKAELQNQKGQAQLTNTQFQVLPSRAYGSSQLIELDEQQQIINLKQSSLTTCKEDTQGQKDWDLKFDTLSIDNEKRRVIGYGTTLYFKQVPVLYTPYFDYPLDDRASGLLFPEIGSYKSITDNNNLSYLKIPYYFNIAPNMDDTLTLTPIQERGLALENEFRYVKRSSGVKHAAEITVTALNDQIVARQGLSQLDENGEVTSGAKESERWRVKLNAEQIWGHGFSSAIDWQAVSDEGFFREIPVQSDLRNASLKKRTARLNYQKNNFTAYAELLSYLRLENAEDNYEKRPEIGLNYYQQHGHFGVDMTATFTDFYVPDEQSSLREGKRLHIVPSIQYQIQNSYAYLSSTLLANLTQYQFSENTHSTIPNSLTEADTVNRSIPQFALQTGLIFERSAKLFGQSFTQTLEPKLQYLYTPYRDQSDITLFDTTNRSLAFSNLFAMNRFTGADRIADSNQASMALTSRLLNSQGKESARASLGQIIYFADRKVTLQENTIDDEKVSDIFLEFATQQNNWSFATTLQLDHKNHDLNNANGRFKWQSKQLNNSLFLMNYALFNAQTNDPIEKVSMGLNTQINPQWSLGLYHSENIDKPDYSNSQAGLRYDSCCWSTEFIAERTQLENGLYNNAIQIQFELKGLSTNNSSFKDDITDQLDF